MSANTAKWYIVNALSGFEEKVAQAIRDQAQKRGLEDRLEEVVVPTESVTELKKGKKVVSEKKIFPGYVLVKMRLDDAIWNTIKNIPKVSGFLGGGGKPVPIPEEEVRRVLKQVEEGAVVKDVDIVFEVGDSIKIIDGPFETFTGVVDEVDDVRRRLKVSVSIFGRPTPVELEYGQVEKVSK